MKLIRGIHNLSQAPHGCVLTIGNFDGVHRGHRALLQGLREEGRKRNLPVMVMIFEPQPLELFATDKSPARLTRLREKLRYLAECGVDYVLCVRFDRRFAALTAQTFMGTPMQFFSWKSCIHATQAGRILRHHYATSAAI